MCYTVIHWFSQSGCYGFDHLSLGNCQKTETCMVWAGHTPQEPLKNHSSGHLGGWATPWSAEEMLDGQHQRVDIPASARTPPPHPQSVKRLNWTDQDRVRDLFRSSDSAYWQTGQSLWVSCHTQHALRWSQVNTHSLTLESTHCTPIPLCTRPSIYPYPCP